MTLLVSLYFFALGALLGSFVGVVAERAYTGQSWKKGRSRCNSCRETLHTQDLLPIVSWLLHRGRCRKCGSKVPWLYTLYEVALGSLFVLACLYLGLGIQLIVFLAALLVLAFTVIYDLRHTIVPPIASASLICISVAFAALSSGSLMIFVSTVLTSSGIALFFFLLYALSRGRAMGLGDTPISFGLSMLVGHAALAGLLFSFWIGGLIGLCILVLRKGGPTMGIEVPFVPFMAAGFLLAFFTQWNPLPF